MVFINEKLWMGEIKVKLEENIRKQFFSVLECGADGDCLFHVVSEALNMELIYNYEIPNYDIAKLVRSLAASQINDDNFVIILESYKAEVEWWIFWRLEPKCNYMY